MLSIKKKVFCADKNIDKSKTNYYRLTLYKPNPYKY